MGLGLLGIFKEFCCAKNIFVLTSFVVNKQGVTK